MTQTEMCWKQLKCKINCNHKAVKCLTSPKLDLIYFCKVNHVQNRTEQNEQDCCSNRFTMWSLNTKTRCRNNKD
jgi:hypothetical protein